MYMYMYMYVYICIYTALRTPVGLRISVLSFQERGGRGYQLTCNTRLQHCVQDTILQQSILLQYNNPQLFIVKFKICVVSDIFQQNM